MLAHRIEMGPLRLWVLGGSSVSGIPLDTALVASASLHCCRVSSPCAQILREGSVHLLVFTAIPQNALQWLSGDATSIGRSDTSTSAIQQLLSHRTVRGRFRVVVPANSSTDLAIFMVIVPDQKDALKLRVCTLDFMRLVPCFLLFCFFLLCCFSRPLIRTRCGKGNR